MEEQRIPGAEPELEDGEICDDEVEEKKPVWRGEGCRPGRAAPPRTRKPRQHLGLPPPDFRLRIPYMLEAHGHGPFGPVRQQCGPSGPERPSSPLPPSLPPPPGLGPHGEPSPRSSFWERSHRSLGRFRHRVAPNGGRGAWSRGNRGEAGNRTPVGRYGPGQNHGMKTESPSRKQKLQSRTQMRKSTNSGSRAETSVHESFEDLLSKYKQIQLELECIRKEETMALEPNTSSIREDHPDLSPSGPEPESVALADRSLAAGKVEALEVDRAKKKVFHAFNIKPLRQKLPSRAALDQSSGTDGGQVKEAEEDQQEKDALVEPSPCAEDKMCPCCTEDKVCPGAKDKTCPCCAEDKTCPGAEDARDKHQRTCLCSRDSSSDDSVLSPDNMGAAAQPGVKVEEEELSELQLRLLALQSASKKWQQKEQQVLKKSKDRITRSAQERKSQPDPGPGTGIPPAGRQRVTTRSVSSAAAATAAAERGNARSKAPDRTKTGQRPLDRDRTKQSPKAVPPPDRCRASAKAYLTKKMVSSGPAAKQLFRKQQLRTWKLQQQRQQEDKRRQEDKRQQDEDDRRKREDEIRRIRDLSNQDEQYNRFMKLVGGKSTTRTKTWDRDHRKSTGKPGLDSSGNLYQYDNYDEVAMDTDSETGSPVRSPTPESFSADGSGSFSLYMTDSAPFGVDFSQPFLPPSLLVAVPMPPPLPPPPDESKPPPKPPLADEEEEEEMLLRETCLMSMANKRVAVPEEKSCSSPPSPNCAPPPVGVQLLHKVNLNTHTRTHKVTRGHVARAPLVLPRHKSVVVSLNDSDDSDSDLDVGSAPGVFGGLEFMIKEARRTVEAAKPKAASGCEKENNPLRIPETEAVKAGGLELQQETFSKEKQKNPLSSASSLTPSAMDSAARTMAEVKLTEAGQRLNKNRELLQRDEAVLKHLLQQELKKKESVKAAEAKVQRLREQLQASEKIVGANKTLLKKLQEQVHRVEHRVSIKKSLAVKLEQEVAQAQLAARRGSKRRSDSNQTRVSKQLRVDSAPRNSERHFAELIAQKQRLQQLESEYALKIQRLKEAQALRNRGAASELPRLPPPTANAAPPDPQAQIPVSSGPLPLPQPSLHDLTQDKLTLDSEDVTNDNEVEPIPDVAPAAAGPRRRSLRQSSCSFTKPNLEQSSTTPTKDGGSKLAKSSSSEAPAEMLAGLNPDSLKLRYRQQNQLRELLHNELRGLGLHLDGAASGQVLPLEAVSCMTTCAELRPVPFGPYHSPLLVFKSYRFSPYYRTKEKLSLSSVTFSNSIQHRKCFCRFDLTGTCNDDGCHWQHMRNCTLKGNQLFQDILSYDLSLIGCLGNSSDDDITAATEKYMKKLFGPKKDGVGVDQKAVLLVSKVNESKRHVPPFTTSKDVRKWRPKPLAQSGRSLQDDGELEDVPRPADLRPLIDERSQRVLAAADVCVTSEDRRYFVSETDDISNLESSVLDSPGDTQLWIKLAFKYLSQSHMSAAECLEAALNTLSRALESNCDDPEVWSHYLSLFSRRGSREEVQEMCEMAVEHAPHHCVWWNYLNLESSFEGKDYVSDRLVQFLVGGAPWPEADQRSFHLMEALLYRAHLHLFTGRAESALALLQSAVKSAEGPSLADHLTAADRAMVWLCYIHLTEFQGLPSDLFDPSVSGPSRLVSRKSFLLPWRPEQDMSTSPHFLLALFQDAIGQCGDESMSPGARTLASLPLHLNLISLYKVLQRYEEAELQCVMLLQSCPESCVLRDALADVHVGKGNLDEAASAWLGALAECPNRADVFYHCCKFLMTQDKSGALGPLFKGFVLSLCEDEQNHRNPLDLLRHILDFPSDGLTHPVMKKDLQNLLSQQRPYLHLIHCRWQWLHGSAEETVEAFERALGSPLRLEELHTLWLDYLRFSSRQEGGAPSRCFSDLILRCLSTVPSRLQLPFNPAHFWSSYSFHNQVATLYLSCLPASQHAPVLERLRYAMPNNSELSLRLLCVELQDGNMELLKFHSRLLTSHFPKSLIHWKIALAVEAELQEPCEVRFLFHQAHQNLPLSAALWTHRLLFEASQGAASDRLRRLLERCGQVGVAVAVEPKRGEGQ